MIRISPIIVICYWLNVLKYLPKVLIIIENKELFTLIINKLDA
nr:MAG TPA: hypothetical protein [Caudoviricetes sp.]